MPVACMIQVLIQKYSIARGKLNGWQCLYTLLYSCPMMTTIGGGVQKWRWLASNDIL